MISLWNSVKAFFIVKKLRPDHEKNYKYQKQKLNSYDKMPPPVTAVELQNSVMTLNLNSALGTDGIGNTLIYYSLHIKSLWIYDPILSF